jgi:predicted PurR-regulated permease PerM
VQAPREPEPRPNLATRREATSARIAFALLAIIASALFLLIVWPFRAPLFLALVLAAVFQGPLEKLVAALRGRRRRAAALITLGVFLVIVVPMASIATFAAREAVTGFSYLRDEMKVSTMAELTTAQLPPQVEAVLTRVQDFVHLTREQLAEKLGLLAALVQQTAPEVLKESGRTIFHTLLMLLAFYFLLVDGRRLLRWLWNVSPLQAEQTEELLAEFHRVATGSIVGTVATALLQGVLAGIGFAIFKVPHAIFFGTLVALSSFIPVIGTALVWVPSVALLALTGHTSAAIGLAAWCAILLSVADHIAKPLILSGTMGGEMHTGMMFLGLLGGLEVFGLLGVILGPLIVSFFLSIMRTIEKQGEAAVRLRSS